MTPNLLPCPFCGGVPELEKVGRDWWRVSHPHVIECILDESTFDYPQTEEDLACAVSDWNTRAKSAPAEVAQWEAVAWLHKSKVLALQEGWSATCYGKPWADRHFKDGGFVPLYTAPPSPDAELVALLSEYRRVVASEVERWKEAFLPEGATDALQKLARIDAKLASL